MDSASGSAAAQLEQHIGVSLFKATEGTEKHYEIENDLMKVTFSNKGGRVASVVLKDYKTYNGSPLVLFPDSAAVFDLSFFVKQQFNNIQINTGDYYFVAISLSGRTKRRRASRCGSMSIPQPMSILSTKFTKTTT